MRGICSFLLWLQRLLSNQPTFPELWETIEPVMGSGLLIAHNAPFDMGVLAQCLNDYRIEWQPFTYYASPV